jgi:hypothetical protein
MIPDKPLNFRALDLELQDYEWLDEVMSGGTFPPGTLKRLRQVISLVSDWNLEELAHLTVRELADKVLPQITGAQKAEEQEAVSPPPANSSDSTRET